MGKNLKKNFFFNVFRFEILIMLIAFLSLLLHFCCWIPMSKEKKIDWFIFNYHFNLMMMMMWMIFFLLLLLLLSSTNIRLCLHFQGWLIFIYTMLYDWLIWIEIVSVNKQKKKVLRKVNWKGVLDQDQFYIFQWWSMNKRTIEFAFETFFSILFLRIENDNLRIMPGIFVTTTTIITTATTTPRGKQKQKQIWMKRGGERKGGKNSTKRKEKNIYKYIMKIEMIKRLSLKKSSKKKEKKSAIIIMDRKKKPGKMIIIFTWTNNNNNNLEKKHKWLIVSYFFFWASWCYILVIFIVFLLLFGYFGCYVEWQVKKKTSLS